MIMQEKEPLSHSKTIRQSIIDELLGGMRTVRELSQTLRIPEKEVLSHLPHIKQTAQHKGYKFIMMPSECLDCGFIFEIRERVKKPGKCPNCKKQHLTNPTFVLMSLPNN